MKNIKIIFCLLLSIIILSLFILSQQYFQKSNTSKYIYLENIDLKEINTITVAKLLSDIDKSNCKNLEKYKNKIFYITGVLEQIEYKYLPEEHYVISLEDDVQFEYRTVNINCPINNNIKYLNAKKGDKISLYVIYNDYVANLYVDCDIILK